MSDWPSIVEDVDTILSSGGPNSVVADLNVNTGNAFNTSGVWPSANRAIYVPVWLSRQVIVYQMSYIVATQAGNYVIGLYDGNGNKLVDSGSQTVPAAGIALFNITDTIIGPGAYYLALLLSSTTASIRRSNVGVPIYRASGILQEDPGSTALPTTLSTATSVSTAYCPLITAHLRATV